MDDCVMSYMGECHYMDIENYQDLKGFVLVSYNCGSLTTERLVEIKDSLVSPYTSVLCISETHLTSNDDSGSYVIPGFNIFRQDRDTSLSKSSGGGLLTYINDSLAADDTVYSSLNVNNYGLECQFIKISKDNTKDIIIINCYRLPDNRSIESRSYAIDTIINNIKSIENFQDKCYIIVGDLNLSVDVSDLDPNSTAIHTKDYIDKICNEVNLVNLIDKNTCFRGSSSSTIDLILTNATNIHCQGILDFGHFDHRPVFLVKKRQHDEKIYEKIVVRNMKLFDSDKLDILLNEVDWDSLKDNDLNTYWINLKTKLIEICDCICPYKNIKIKKNLPPWYHADLSFLRMERDRLGRRYRLDKKNVSKKNDFREASNEFKRKLFHAKQDYTMEKLEENLTDQKKFWNELQKILPSKIKNSFNSIYNESNVLLNGKEALNYINRYFSSVGDRIDDQLKNYPPAEEPEIFSEDSYFDLDSLTFNQDEVYEIIDKLSLSKSSGIPELNTRLLKEIFARVPFVLSDIFKLSFEKGIVPDEWKVGYVTVIPKKGNNLYVDNLRPITQTNLLMKTFEKIVNKNLMEYFESFEILHPNQGGFRKNHSTIETVSTLVNFISEAKNKKEYSIAVFLDLSKAFDSVNHFFLIDKLKNMGVKGNLLRWLKNYLENRCQIVKSKNSSSDTFRIKSGVPQGSVLGPTLFLAYINDIKHLDLTCNINLFADDTVLYSSGPNLENLLTSIQEDLNKICNWCTFNKLCLNAKKTNVLCFGKSFFRHPDFETIPKLTLLSQSLDFVEECDYLGIRLDYKLNMNSFMSKVKKSVLHKIYLLTKLRKFLTLEASITIFKSMVLPYFEYGNIFLEACEVSVLKKLDRVFVRGLRVTLKNYEKTDEHDLMKNVKILPLQMRREISIAKLMFNKLSKNEVNVQKKTSARIHDGPALEWPEVTNDKFKRYIPHLGPTVWNRLPSEIRNIQDKDSFKTMIRKHYESLFENSTDKK